MQHIKKHLQRRICIASVYALGEKRCHKVTAALLAILIVVSAICPAAMAQDVMAASVAEASNQIDELTKQLLLKEIELERFNLHYVLEAAKQGRWKGWRYAGAQEVNTGLNLTGGIISTVNRGRYLHNAKGVKLGPQEAANYIPMIGSIIGASAAAAEFNINVYHELMAKKHGYSPGVSLAKVKTLKDQIYSLMDKRNALIEIEAMQPEFAKHVLVDRAEGKLLQDNLDQTLKEFARYHVSARRLLAFQQAQYLIDAGKYSTNAIGAYFAYLSLARKQRIWNGRAGVLFAVSGQMTMWGPIISRLYGKGVSIIASRRVNAIMRDQADASIATLQTDLAALDKIVNKGSASEAALGSATEKETIFEENERAFSEEIRTAQKRANAAKLTATQNIGAGIFVGGSKTASSVLFLIPGYDNRYNTKTARAGKVTNELLFSSAVVGLPAGGFSMADTLRIQVMGEIARHKAAKKGILPAQIAATRLKKLDDMEERLKQIH